MTYKLALIGDQIAGSLSPLLHRSAAQSCGLELEYQLLVPAKEGLDFEALYQRCKTNGYDGINVTYPYKQQIPESLIFDETLVAEIGAVNTVAFGPGGARGSNTDYSGFLAGYRYCFPDQTPEVVTLFGAGGVGKAIAFSLLTLGVKELRLVDSNQPQALALSRVLRALQPNLKCTVYQPQDTIPSSAGLINCTPVGMQKIPGCAVHEYLMSDARWCFDAIYDPVETVFIQRAKARGIPVMTGIDLFLFMGMNTFHFFTGQRVEIPELVKLLQSKLAGLEQPDNRRIFFDKYLRV